MDCVVGGGWPHGRIINIVGDKSTGKTLLCIEAAANFALQYPGGRIRYREAESAFDRSYAGALGMPLDRVEFGDDSKPIITVEDMYKDLKEYASECLRAKIPGIYFIDSLDALSDESELNQEIDQASYGASKAKQMSRLFRELTQTVEKAKVTFFVVSQVRDKIGITFGKKTSRSGGRALDFYASIVLYLSHIKTNTRTIKRVKRAVSIRIKAKCEKNKIGLPLRSCEFNLIFAYGVYSLGASLEWLKEVGRLEAVIPKGQSLESFIADAEKLEDEDYRILLYEIDVEVTKIWREIEQSFLPKRQKYNH